jgi:hypothetical protein
MTRKLSCLHFLGVLGVSLFGANVFNRIRRVMEAKTYAAGLFCVVFLPSSEWKLLLRRKVFQFIH